jgi:hypothetical protein
MATNSMRRKGRIQWRVILGLGFLGFLILASASSHAGNRLPAKPDQQGWCLSLQGSR